MIAATTLAAALMAAGCGTSAAEQADYRQDGVLLFKDGSSIALELPGGCQFLHGDLVPVKHATLYLTVAC